MPSTRGLYLYCLARPDLPADALATRGIDDRAPLFLLPHGRIAAVLSEVALDEFTGPEAEAHMQDLAWLTPRALRHEEIVERILQSSPVLPARFATLFTSRERVTQLLAAHHDTVAAFLDRTAGKREWSLKLYLDRGRARDALIGTALAEQAAQHSSSPGTRYLQERRLRGEADRMLERWLDETSAHLREELLRRAPDFVARKPLAATSPDAPGEMVANWAFLLPELKAEGFREAALEALRPLAERGLSGEFAGPLPPYSFTPPLPEPEESPRSPSAAS